MLFDDAYVGHFADIQLFLIRQLLRNVFWYLGPYFGTSIFFNSAQASRWRVVSLAHFSINTFLKKCRSLFDFQKIQFFIRYYLPQAFDFLPHQIVFKVNLLASLKGFIYILFNLLSFLLSLVVLLNVNFVSIAEVSMPIFNILSYLVCFISLYLLFVIFCGVLFFHFLYEKCPLVSLLQQLHFFL